MSKLPKFLDPKSLDPIRPNHINELKSALTIAWTALKYYGERNSCACSLEAQKAMRKIRRLGK